MGKIEVDAKVINGETDKEKEVIIEIDTGAEKTIIREDILKELECEMEREITMIDINENKTKKMLYRAIIKIEGIKGCNEPISLPVIGGKRNLLGKDILQAFNAVIDEKKEKMFCPYVSVTHSEIER